MSLPARRPHDAPAFLPLRAVIPEPEPEPEPEPTPRALPRDVEAALWRGDQIGTPVTAVVPTGFAALDAELPGGGWPCGALTELLQPQPGVAEWRLLGDAVRRAVTAGRTLVVVAPPHAPTSRWWASIWEPAPRQPAWNLSAFFNTWRLGAPATRPGSMRPSLP